MLAKRWRTPAVLVVVAGLVLWWAGRGLDPREVNEWGIRPPTGPLALIIALAGGLIVIYTVLAKQANIQCESNRLVIHVPLMIVAVSYARVVLTRPVEFRSIFPPEEEKSARFRIYRSLYGKTIPVVDLKGYPLPKWWLRLWLHPYLLHPKETALVVPVEDWMTFTRTVDSLRTQWRENKRASS
jgi:hypothetical protein